MTAGFGDGLLTAVPSATIAEAASEVVDALARGCGEASFLATAGADGETASWTAAGGAGSAAGAGVEVVDNDTVAAGGVGLSMDSAEATDVEGGSAATSIMAQCKCALTRDSRSENQPWREVGWARCN